MGTRKNKLSTSFKVQLFRAIIIFFILTTSKCVNVSFAKCFQKNFLNIVSFFGRPKIKGHLNDSRYESQMRIARDLSDVLARAK